MGGWCFAGTLVFKGALDQTIWVLEGEEITLIEFFYRSANKMFKMTRVGFIASVHQALPFRKGPSTSAPSFPPLSPLVGTTCLKLFMLSDPSNHILEL